ARRRGKRLRALLKEFRKSASAFPDAAIILSNDNEAVYFNKAAGELLGLKKRVDRGQRVENLVRAPQFVEYLHSEHYDDPIEFPLPPGNRVWVSCRVVSYGPDQQLLILQDITRKKMLETMRRDFVANASHELRTPLTVITGYLDVLADEPELAADVKAPLMEMSRQSGRMRVLLEDLLRLSELESSESSSKDTPVDVDALMSAARQAAVVLDNAPAVIEIFSESTAAILGEQSELQSVVSNLVVNAANHTDPDGRITMRWWTDEEGGYLSVEDTGIGLSQVNIPRITERFFRVDAGRSRDQGGTGLGLAIVKHALNHHEASLSIVSELDVGSTFICKFPSDRVQH
ncbi:MAG: phosphate regulon sensor histidine kinase PhoR, partial [Gammaproteobacteria bacterium]|nr:phosphate regulon sensor histidine kinase PhoR [Gammaproteobacteria bacterium]